MIINFSIYFFSIFNQIYAGNYTCKKILSQIVLEASHINKNTRERRLSNPLSGFFMGFSGMPDNFAPLGKKALLCLFTMLQL
jgi:hypothetical protein